jgi:hypothetical protein
MGCGPSGFQMTHVHQFPDNARLEATNGKHDLGIATHETKNEATNMTDETKDEATNMTDQTTETLLPLLLGID